jgi:three-Cys-motif partner protein
MHEKLVLASDARWALNIKPHTIRKLKVLEYYLSEFTTSMRPTGRTTGFRGFEERNYIDLFAGPGRCVVSGQMPSGTEVDGSPLIALKVKHPFSNYYFVDLEQKSVDALAQRVAGISGASSSRFFTGDCNEKIGNILSEIDTRYSVNVALIDSFTIACKWSTIKALGRCKRMDLIINFPMGMAINRNLHRWVNDEASALDDFFGNQKWRNIYFDNVRLA